MRLARWLVWLRLLRLGICLVLAMTACSNKPQAGIDPEEVSAGEYSYEVHCAECHEQPHPDLLKQPPNLHGTFGRKTLPSGAPATDKQVRRTIIEGRGTMPAFDKRLSNEELDELVRYLHTLK
jgi:mono/diheme cytochrome c family protein